MAKKLTVTPEQLTSFSLLKNEPDWFLDIRLKALELAKQLPLPFIERVKFHRWNLFQSEIGESNSLITELEKDIPSAVGSAKIVQLGAVSYWEEMNVETAMQDVLVMDLFEALQQYPELVKPYYMTKAVPVDEDSLTAYHAAMVNSGIFIYVPKNVVLEDIIESHFVQNNTVDEAFVKHVLIVAEENSSLSYVERFESIGDRKNTANIIVEVIAKEGAKVHFAAVDTLGQPTDAYINRRGYLEKDATIEWALGIMNDGNVIADFDSELRGVGSTAKVNVVAISTGKQVQGIDTRVTNYANHSVGHILQHGVILDKSTLTFNGIGHIIKGAKFADAQQESRVLMLSEGGRGDANPILLIDENEVTAGHAASVGQVDDEQLFYLTSRGISQAEAKRLVIRGFLGSVISAIPAQNTQKELVEMIDQKLAKNDEQ